jgi:hypothetical protein
MAIFKTPRATTSQRSSLLLEAGEIVYDTDQKVFYGGNGITLGGFPLGASISGGIPETFTLTQQDILNKYVTLSITPYVPEAVELDILGGIPQRNGVDFVVENNILKWDGLGLDNFLEENDVLVVQY